MNAQIECGCPACAWKERNSAPEHCARCGGPMVPLEKHGYFESLPQDAAKDVPEAIAMIRRWGRFVVSVRRYGTDGTMRVYFSGRAADVDMIREVVAQIAAKGDTLRQLVVVQGPVGSVES